MAKYATTEHLIQCHRCKSFGPDLNALEKCPVCDFPVRINWKNKELTINEPLIASHYLEMHLYNCIITTSADFFDHHQYMILGDSPNCSVINCSLIGHYNNNPLNF